MMWIFNRRLYVFIFWWSKNVPISATQTKNGKKRNSRLMTSLRWLGANTWWWLWFYVLLMKGKREGRWEWEWSCVLLWEEEREGRKGRHSINERCIFSLAQTWGRWNNAGDSLNNLKFEDFFDQLPSFSYVEQTSKKRIMRSLMRSQNWMQPLAA